VLFVFTEQLMYLLQTSSQLIDSSRSDVEPCYYDTKMKPPLQATTNLPPCQGH